MLQKAVINQLKKCLTNQYKYNFLAATTQQLFSQSNIHNYSNNNQSILQQQNLRLKQQNKRFKQQKKLGLQNSQLIKSSFQMLQSAKSQKQLINTYANITQNKFNRLNVLQTDIFINMNTDCNNSCNKLRDQILQITNNQQIPLQHKIQVFEMQLMRNIYQSDTQSFWAVSNQLQRQGLLDKISKGFQKTFMFIKNFFKKCINAVSEFLNKVGQFIVQIGIHVALV